MGNNYVETWQRIFDQCYQKANGALNKAQNFTGWQSSYTGEPIPVEEMKAWLEETVGRVLEADPRKIYEIGVGLGLIMFPLLDKCESYCATDFSEASIKYLKDFTPSNVHHVKFMQKLADDFSGYEEGEYDTFLLNSVVQYFPDHSYLEKVLDGVMERVASGGVIFIGDVRDPRYFEAFHASVEMSKLLDSRDILNLRENIKSRMGNDVELAVSPEFFTNLPKKYSRVSYVEMRLKKGIIQNELTKFRYDVFVHIEKEPPKPVKSIPWTLDYKGLKLQIEEQRKDFQVVGVPNYSVVGIFEAMKLLNLKKDVGIGELKACIDSDKASGQWKVLYSLFPSGLKVEPIVDVADEQLCFLEVRRSSKVSDLEMW